MFPELKSVSFMGVVSKSEMIFPLEFEDACDIAPLEDNFDRHLDKEEEEVQDQEQEKEKQDDKYEILVSNLEVKLPSLGGEIRIQDNPGEEDEDEDDGLKTPTSLDHKIPCPILTCPPAPRKPKSSPSTKRKSSHLTAILDLSNEIESLFSPAYLADLGGKIKKVRQGTDTK